ncbi:AraC family transcriptional regulator [Flavobacterium sp. 90]|uniref:AraC family transcriptional regulator n=1 Tax=unclassified Flavobacterium TaxID=196869 RepID=UPI000EACB6C7|nr:MULTISPECIES: GyrI-like domain-containing protein [unclassified Flavobacterium]RKR09208.1 AraC family transcriptional regulator [Flavobacterium sp. 81]TCK52992.1 AraC family transcriptional regulator [Flavobacterium sp. 90]
MTVTDKEIQADYKNRINRVFEFIDQNLESDLSLNTVSEIAFFSPFHFHRVFKFVTEETLHEYVKRRRIEKSASDLLHKNITATEIAHKYGFSDNSSYSRAFKKHFGVSPTEFKGQNPNRFSKIRQLKSKNGQEYPDYEKYICVINNLKNWIKMNAKIEIKEMSKMDLAYVSSIGPDNLENAYGKLVQWATPKGLINGQTKMITVYHDSFKITEANKVRMSASILLDKAVETNGEIGLTTIEAGKFIVGSFEIGLQEFEKSWTGLFVWMNENGYKKADREPFEIYYNNFNEHPERKAIVDFYIPIE